MHRECAIPGSTNQARPLLTLPANAKPGTPSPFAGPAINCISAAATAANSKPPSSRELARDPCLLSRVQPRRRSHPLHILVMVHTHHQATPHPDNRQHRLQLFLPYIHHPHLSLRPANRSPNNRFKVHPPPHTVSPPLPPANSSHPSFLRSIPSP